METAKTITQTLFYWTGLIAWLIITLYVLLLILGTLYQKVYIGSALFSRIEWIKFVLFYDKKAPINNRTKEFVEARIAFLEKECILKYELRTLKEYLKNVPLKPVKETDTIFSN